MPVEDVVNYWVDYNNCNPVPEIIEVPDIEPGDGCTATHFIYSGGSNDTRVELFRINDGGHTWPGTIFLIGVTNKDINASLEIWRFFLKYRLDVLSDVSNHVLTPVQFTVYPNPVANTMYIQTSDAPVTEIHVYNALGDVIQTRPVTISNTIALPVENLPSGIYTVQCKINGKYYFQKIIKQ